MTDNLEYRFKPVLVDILDRFIADGTLAFGIEQHHHPINRLFSWSCHRTFVRTSPMTFNGSFVFASQNDLAHEMDRQGYLHLIQGTWSNRVFSPYAWGEGQLKMEFKRWPAAMARLALSPTGMHWLSNQYAVQLLLPGEDPPVLKRMIADEKGFVVGDPMKADHSRLFFFEPSQQIRSYWPGRPDVYGCLHALSSDLQELGEGAYG